MNNIFFYEGKRFFKNNIKSIIAGSIIVCAVYILFQLLLGHFFPVNNEQVDEAQQELTIEDVSPAYSQFYIENEDGSVFTNTSLILNYLFLTETVEGLQQETGVDFEAIIEETSLRSEMNEEEVRQEVFYLYRDGSSNTYNFFIQLGSEDKNLAVMNYFYGLILNQELPILESRNVFEINPPKITALEEEEDQSVEAGGQNQINTGIVLDAVIGILMGFIMIVIFYLIESILGKKLKYSFSYEREMDDLFLIHDEQFSDESELTNFVFQPLNTNKAIVSQYNLDSFEGFSTIVEKIEASETLTLENKLSDVQPEFNVEEVIVVVQGGETDKNWYKQQRRLIKNTAARVKIIHLNEAL